jgi:hypothetical protein
MVGWQRKDEMMAEDVRMTGHAKFVEEGGMVQYGRIVE